MFWHLARMDESANANRFFQQFLRVIGGTDRTSSHLLVGPNEERPIISQPQCGRCQMLAWTDHSGGYWQQAELCTEMV